MISLFLRLYYEFFKVGLFAIGGGMATVPFLQEMGKSTGWFSPGELADMIAVSESTPGPIGINMATYVGYVSGVRHGGAIEGILGSVIATVAIVTAPIIIILIIAKFLEKFRENIYVNAALYGLRTASVALIAAAGISIVLFSIFQVENVYDIGKAVIDYRCFILAAAILVVTRWVPKVKEWHPIIFIAISAAIGIIFHMSV